MCQYRLNKGFTLIELVIVIVLLGIITVTIVPKIVDIQRDAVVSSMHNLGGSIKSTYQIVYLKSTILGKHKLVSGTISINNQDIDIVYGYPTANSRGLVKLIDNNADDWNNNRRNGDWHSRGSIHLGAWVYWHGRYKENAGNLACYIRYRQPTNLNVLPVIDIVIQDC